MQGLGSGEVTVAQALCGARRRGPTLSPSVRAVSAGTLSSDRERREQICSRKIHTREGMLFLRDQQMS